MEKKELDDALYASMTEALANSGVPITARAKARIADELCAEAVRLVTVQLRVEGATKPEPKKPRKVRVKRNAQATLPGVPDPTIPAPFGARK